MAPSLEVLLLPDGERRSLVPAPEPHLRPALPLALTAVKAGGHQVTTQQVTLAGPVQSGRQRAPVYRHRAVELKIDKVVLAPIIISYHPPH